MTKYNFTNVILVIVFNYAECLENIEFLNKLYQDYFKKIIIYSDNPKNNSNLFQEKYPDINFIDIDKGKNVNAVFPHLYRNYNVELEKADGLFYTMDDNLINLNILNNYRNDKIIYYREKLNEIDNLNNEQLNFKKGGRNDLKVLMEESLIKNNKISKFCVCFADFFYLPQKYLSQNLFDIFELFSKYNIFLEISIPSIINNLERSINNYNYFDSLILWGKDRKEFKSYQYIKEVILRKHNLFIHPIKLKNNYELKKWLQEFFFTNKCVVITTINKPTQTIINHIDNPKYHTIIVGDTKTPSTYKKLNCVYLDINYQNKLFPKLSNLIPKNHYSRKNLGYLYAIKKGYDIIYETDDDNIPLENFDYPLKVFYQMKNEKKFEETKFITEKDDFWINIFSYYTSGSHIWPRGLPLTKVKNKSNYSIKKNNITPSIICGLIEGEPDVDAIYRLTHNYTNKYEKNIKWKNDNMVVNNKNMCVFNTQNTFWVNLKLFLAMYIPSSVSFRYSDILRGIICNQILKLIDENMMFTGCNVVQIRNEHDLMKDLSSEQEMYFHNENILQILEKVPKNSLKCIYLIQAKGGLPKYYECFRGKKKYILLSYQEKTEETDIYFPNSTWTSGRNKIWEYLKENELYDYDYYIFLDEDINFLNKNNGEGFQEFENLLNIYRPNIGTPYLTGYHAYLNIKNNISYTTWFDGICNAYHKSTLLNKNLFPLDETFDETNWWMSQYIQILKCYYYDYNILLFKNLGIQNTQTTDYPKQESNVIDKKCIKLVKKKILEKKNELNPEKKFEELLFKKQRNLNLNPVYQSNEHIKEYLINIYQKLNEKKITTDLDIDILKEWLQYF